MHARTTQNSGHCGPGLGFEVVRQRRLRAHITTRLHGTEAAPPRLRARITTHLLHGTEEAAPGGASRIAQVNLRGERILWWTWDVNPLRSPMPIKTVHIHIRSSTCASPALDLCEELQIPIIESVLEVSETESIVVHAPLCLGKMVNAAIGHLPRVHTLLLSSSTQTEGDEGLPQLVHRYVY